MPVVAKIAIATLALGICLIGASFAWQQDLGFNRGYSEEDALEYAQASANLHDAMHESAHNHGESDEHQHVDVTAAQARFDEAQSKRDGALTSRNWTSAIMKWSGFAITIGSAITLWLKRE